MVSFDSCEGKMPLVLKSLSSRVLSSWIFHLPYKSMNDTKSDQCQNLGSIGLAKKFMWVFLCLLNGMFYRTNFLANHMCVCVCVCVYPLYIYVYIYNYIYVGSEMAQLCLTLCDPMFCSLLGSSILWIFLARVTGEDCHFLLQGIFPTQGLNLHLPHCRQMLYHLSH